MDQPPEIRRRTALKAASMLRKFSSTEIAEIRKLRGQGLTLISIADMYGVVKSTISYIVNRRTYK